MATEAFKNYDGNLSWLEDRTIFMGLGGSHAYGTNTPTSDIDFRGVAIPPREYLLGVVKRFDQALWTWGDGTGEATVFSLHKFVKLALDCNPNVIELLFTEPVVDSLQWRTLVQNRDAFVSKKAKFTFSGYAMSQLKRIKTHRKWLLDPPQKPPTRWDFGLPEETLLPKDHIEAAEAAIQKQLDAWELNLDWLGKQPGIEPALKQQLIDTVAELTPQGEDRYVAAARQLGINDNMVEVMRGERRYREAKRHWQNYQTWLRQRNEARAKLEAEHGYDTKHGMHLVRLMRMGVEILEGKGVIVRRPDAAELLSIRRGAWPYDMLISWAEAQDARLQELYRTSTLPKKPDVHKVDEVVIHLVEQALA